MVHSPTPRFDRIISLVMIVMLGLAVIFLIEVSPNILRVYLGGDLPVITVSWLLIASLVVVSSAGADILARSHPEMQTRTLPTLRLGTLEIELAPGFWILPAFTIIISFAFFRLFSDLLPGGASVLALLATGGLLVSTLVAQHYSCDRNPATRAGAQLGLQAITYLLAFGCFSAIYYARFRALYAAALIGSSATLLAFALLHWDRRRRKPLLLSLLVGLMLAEAIWALNYWATTFLIGGTLLLVLFYTATGVLQHYLAGTLTRRIVLEFGSLGLLLFMAIVYATYG